MKKYKLLIILIIINLLSLNAVNADECAFADIEIGGDISKAIEKLLGNQALIDKFGKNSRKLVENNFSDKIISENFLKLYKIFLSRQPL